MKLRRTLVLCFFPALLALSGCSSYISRIVLQSFGRIGQPIPAPPRMITTPVLQNTNLAVSWVGHATVLLQIHDKIFITDPFLTSTIGMLVKRSVRPGLDPALLPKVDFTLISHIHLDHFNYGSLDMLPKSGVLAVPKGAAEYTPDFGFKEVSELGPWQMIERDGVRVTAVPVQHFTGRYGFDGAWLGSIGYTGYVIEYNGLVVFFAGDTGYNPELFKEIGRQFKVDLAIVPIAPGSLVGVGSRVHTGPLGALAIFKDVGAKYLLPVHYGTLFYGSDANPNEPMDRLREAAAQQNLSDRVIGLEVGEQRVLF
ncbi:MAG: Lactamase protein [Bacteroidetes bacterium]|nr:Lactamase protein [Bacteroidota bacterium]